MQRKIWPCVTSVFFLEAMRVHNVYIICKSTLYKICDRARRRELDWAVVEECDQENDISLDRARVVDRLDAVIHVFFFVAYTAKISPSRKT